MSFWASGFWAEGFWAPGFWADEAVVQEESPTRVVRAIRRTRAVGYRPVALRLVATEARKIRSISYERQAMRVVSTQATGRVVSYWKTARTVTAKATTIRRVTSMGTAKKVDDLDMEESAVIEFDFTEELGSASIVDAVVTVDLREGQDPTPASLKSGNRTLVPGGKKVTQLVAGQMPKCSYAIRCVVSCDDQQDRTAVALLKVVRL